MFKNTIAKVRNVAALAIIENSNRRAANAQKKYEEETPFVLNGMFAGHTHQEMRKMAGLAVDETDTFGSKF